MVTCDGEYVSVGVKWYAYIGGASTFQKREKKDVRRSGASYFKQSSRTFAFSFHLYDIQWAPSLTRKSRDALLELRVKK